jgi:hypothetical protein
MPASLPASLPAAASSFVDPVDYLMSVDAIRQLKARYCRYIDTKQWHRLAALFTPDCRFEGLGSAPPGADVAAFVAGVSSRLAPTISAHHVHQHEVAMTGPDSARVIWAMEDFVEFTDGSTVKETPGSRGFRGYGHYEEEYRRDDGEWRISFLRLTRLRVDPVPVDAPPPRMGQRQATPGWLDPSAGQPG